MILRTGLTAGVLVIALARAGLASTETECVAGRMALNEGTEQVLNLIEAADYLRVDSQHLEAAAVRGEVPGRLVLGGWRFSRAVLVVWMAGVDNPEDCFLVASNDVPGDALSNSELAGVQGAGLTAERAGDDLSSARSQSSADDDTQFGEQPVTETARDVALRREEILLTAGEATLEPSIFYSVQNGDGVVLVPFGGGFLPIESETESDTLAGVLTGRYGLVDDVQLFAAASLLYEYRSISTPAGSTSTSQVEFGDIGVGVRYGLMKEGPGRPSVIISGEGVVPTNGTNGYGVGGGLALVKSVDPVALFASGDYLHTFSSDPNFTGEIQADDTIVATAGYSLALNDSLAIGTSVSGAFARFDGATETWDDVYSLRFSLTSLLDSGLYVEPSVAFSLAGEDSQVLFCLTVPYTFIL